jgi:hypothetical protein
MNAEQQAEWQEYQRAWQAWDKDAPKPPLGSKDKAAWKSYYAERKAWEANNPPPQAVRDMRRKQGEARAAELRAKGYGPAVFNFGATVSARRNVVKAAWGNIVQIVRDFRRDRNGVAAIEAAIIFPVLLAFTIGCIVIFQAEQQRSTAAYIAQACASAASRVLAVGNMSEAQAEAQKIFDSNSALWIFGASPSLGDVTSSDGVMVSCTVSSTSNPVMPLPGLGILSASVTATD